MSRLKIQSKVYIPKIEKPASVLWSDILSTECFLAYCAGPYVLRQESNRQNNDLPAGLSRGPTSINRHNRPIHKSRLLGRQI